MLQKGTLMGSITYPRVQAMEDHIKGLYSNLLTC
jgi:hypothetical protein